MALIKYGSTVAMIAGSIGGSTYARNRYGAYIRNRTKPVDPGSNLQTEYRTRVSNAVAAWQALTAAQRDAFNAKASTTVLQNRIGESFHPSGINLFIRTYNLLDIAGLDQVTVPPVSPIAQDPSSTFVYVADPGFKYTAHLAQIEDGSVCLVWWAYDKTNSTFFFKGPYSDFDAFTKADMAPEFQTLEINADLAVDSSMFGMARVIQADGAASHARRMRCYKPPA